MGENPEQQLAVTCIPLRPMAGYSLLVVSIHSI
jgi:hypothetical protein